jgi:hypothetical protein
MTLKSIKRVKTYIYKLKKWILKKNEKKQVFIIKERIIIDLKKAINCFIKVIKNKIRL